MYTQVTTEPLTAVQVGLGPIGARIVRSARNRGIEFVGAVDVDPDKVGRDLAAVAGLEATAGVRVTEDLASALAADPDLAFHATVSGAAAAQPQLEPILEAGVDVVTTCEELVYPWRDHAAVGRAIDECATHNGATCLGTGINPGFVMDALPAVLSTPLETVTSVRVERVQDAGTRREPLQRKVGAGTDPARFEREVAGEAGHVGSPESAAMLAAALGWELDTISETVDPVIAEEPVETDALRVDEGDVAGVHQVTHGTVDGVDRLTLDLRMAVGLDSRDRVAFEGDPPVTITVEGGYHGDVATSAVVANCAGLVADAEPGLATMIDLRLPSFAPGGA